MFKIYFKRHPFSAGDGRRWQALPGARPNWIIYNPCKVGRLRSAAMLVPDR